MAARFLVAGGNGNWTSNTNWALTSGGTPGVVAAPTVADDVTFDVNSGATNLTIDTAGQSAKTVTMTAGYTGTFTFTNTLTCAGSYTQGANVTYAGASALIISATATLTSNGKTLGVPLSIANTATITLADNWTVSGNVAQTTTVGPVINGNTLNIGGSLTLSFTTGNLSGTTLFVMNGTGTLSMPSVTTGRFNASLEINTAGIVTLSGTWRHMGTFKVTTGTTHFVTSGSTLAFFNGASTLTVNDSGVTFPTLQNLSAIAVTINGSNGFTIGTLTSLIALGTFTFLSGNTYIVNSSIILTGTSAGHITLNASTGSSDTFINFTGNTMALAYCDLTDINASGGRFLQSYGGSMTRATNAVAVTQITGGGVPRSRMI